MIELQVGAEAMLAPVLLYGLAALLAIGARRSTSLALRAVPSLLIALGGLAGAAVAIQALLDRDVTRLSGWSVTPYAQLAFQLDSLAAFFLLVISVPAIATAIYGIGYGNASHHDTGFQTGPPARAALDLGLSLFLAAMTLLVLADDLLAFLITWELMSLMSFFLVIGDGQRVEIRRAGYIYIIMTHIATGFLLLAFLMLARHAGATDFAAWRTAAATLGGWEQSLIFLLALLGFGTKAGLIPLHVWLPRAHPAAPSHVSALMSGVMVKTALYGLIRVAWEFTGTTPAWWGWVLIAAGVVSAVLGILYALTGRDVKRVLAYSTVEHIGIICIGLGASLVLSSNGHSTAAALALIAALVHLFNHMLFKGLLFLGAGAIQTATGTRDIERLGGLIRRMPRTAIFFLIGAAAIAVLPPLNGFIGEWLMLQSLLQLATLDGGVVGGTGSALAAAALGLTGGLALACFVRLFGIAFLAQPRTPEAEHAHEVSRSMQTGMALLACLCVILGLAPALLFRLLQPVTQSLMNASIEPSLSLSGALRTSGLDGSYAPLALILGFAALGLVPWIISRLIGGPARSRVAPTWVCGREIEPQMQYSATAFVQPLRRIFQPLIRAHQTIDLVTKSRYVVSSIRYVEGMHPVYERHIYQRVVNLLYRASNRIRLLQNGSIRSYLSYIFVTLVIVLILAR